jgi:endonuclease I
MRYSRLFVALGILTLATSSARGDDPFDPPPGYYGTATGTGPTLKAQLNDIIDQNTSVSYSNREAGIEFLDQDPNNSANVIEVYSGFSVPKTDFLPGDTPVNTEHLWPNSYGIDDTNPAYGDFFNLRPCDASVNSSRGNKYYDIVGGTTPAHPEAPECRTDSTRWEPRPIEKGDLARSMFYLDTRYEGDPTDAFARNLQLTDNVATITSSNNNFGKLSTLVQWHFEDPVADVERQRNHRIYSGCGYANPASCQHNRNPFIDRPEFVWAVFGSSPNDSTLYFGDVIPSDGASPVSLELPTIIFGASPWSNAALVLKKAGTTPTTYEITLSGEAASNSAGPRRAFVGGAQTLNITAGLTAPAGVGLHSGTLTVNNTDLTSAAAAQGNADGDDIVSVTGTVLDHADPSFDGATDQQTLVLDFGSIQQGSGPQNLSFAIYNRETTAGFTSRLDVLSVNGSGDVATLTTNAAPVANLSAPSSSSFNATLDTSNDGVFSATYTLTTHDENLLGGIALPDLVLTLTASVTASVPCIAADANCDLMIDEFDIAPFADLLLGALSPCGACAGDLNGDTLLNGDDISPFVDIFLNP